MFNRRLYKYSFGILLFLPLISIIVKAILGVDGKYIVVDAVVFGQAFIVFVGCWIVVYKRRNLVKRINESVIPYILTSLLIATQSIRFVYYLDRNFVNKWVFFVFEEGFSIQLSLLYLCMLAILSMQSVIIFTQILYRRKPITTIYLPKSYQSMVALALFNVAVVGLLLIIKAILGNNQGKVMDSIYLVCASSLYFFILFLHFVLNRFKFAKHVFKQSLLIIIVQTSLLWIILLFLSLDFVGTVLQYLLLGIVNIVALVWFYKCSKVKPDVLEIFE
ncbi:MAG: hypothetical protein FWF56_05470 [Firmicutes bacterium]|nr:hypothetical protein [Bacillota bacterium]MCL1953618.1 hypothetical protein [Bacillota bacterium]